MMFRIIKDVFKTIVISVFLICCLLNCKDQREFAIDNQINKDSQLIIQLAELTIDSAQLEIYLEFLREEIQKSVDIEPGVLTLYAMQAEDDPNKITIVEIYADEKSYQSHISSPHFLKYKNGTLSMVDSLRLNRMNPVIFASKSNGMK